MVDHDLIQIMFNSQCVLLQSGVFLSLNGITIPNDGYIVSSDIGVDGGGLYCNTDRTDCCRGSDAPDGVATSCRDTGTALMGLKLGVSYRRLLMIPVEISSSEIGLLE